MLARARRTRQYAPVSHARSRSTRGLLVASLFVFTSCIVDTERPLQFGMPVSPTGEIAIAPLWCEASPAQTVEADVRAVTNDGVVLPPFLSARVEVRFHKFTSLGTIPRELRVETASIDGVPIRSVTTKASP